MPELTFTSKSKKGPSIKQCKEVYAKAEDMMGGSFAIDRMSRQGSKYTLTLSHGPRGGTSLEGFTKRLRF